MAARGWTCQRTTNGKRCGHLNPSKRTMLCAACGKRRPKTKRPAHMAALDEFDYVKFVAEHGEVCGICGTPPKPGKRLHRDHDHRRAVPRGLLCFRDNTALRPYMDLAWLRAAVAYMEAAEARNGGQDFSHPAQSSVEQCRDIV